MLFRRRRLRGRRGTGCDCVNRCAIFILGAHHTRAHDVIIKIQPSMQTNVSLFHYKWLLRTNSFIHAGS